MRKVSDSEQRGLAALGILVLAGILCFLPPSSLLFAYVIGVIAGAGACEVWRSRQQVNRNERFPAASGSNRG